MDLASRTLYEYKTIIEFYFEFFSVQNFKAFFWHLIFLKSVYAITPNLRHQSFWNFAQYFFNFDIFPFISHVNNRKNTF